MRQSINNKHLKNKTQKLYYCYAVVPDARVGFSAKWPEREVPNTASHICMMDYPPRDLDCVTMVKIWKVLVATHLCDDSGKSAIGSCTGKAAAGLLHLGRCPLLSNWQPHTNRSESGISMVGSARSSRHRRSREQMVVWLWLTQVWSQKVVQGQSLSSCCDKPQIT